jgi:hypothetical protein
MATSQTEPLPASPPGRGLARAEPFAPAARPAARTASVAQPFGATGRRGRDKGGSRQRNVPGVAIYLLRCTADGRSRCRQTAPRLANESTQPAVTAWQAAPQMQLS